MTKTRRRHRTVNVRIYRRRSSLAKHCGHSWCNRPAMVAYELVTPSGMKIPVVACIPCARDDGVIE